MTEEEREIARELWEHRKDPNEWEDEAEALEVRPSPSEVVSFRLPTEEFDLLVESAQQEAESLSEYIRKAVAIRMHGTPIGPAVQVSSGGGGQLVVRSHIVTGSRTEAPGSIVPDLPPLLQSVR